MYLLLGSPHDPCCSSVQAALHARGHSARIVDNPLAHPARFSWYLDRDRSVSQLVPDEDEPDELEGVLVRGAGWVDPGGWQPNDLVYMQAETQAAMLAWLWSLPCPVVNRYPAGLWYRPQLSLLFWRPVLWSCGLVAPPAAVTNVEDEARAFRRRSAAGVVYAPLTSPGRYLVSTEQDWAGLAAMQRRAPVCVTDPHGEPQLVCVVGERIVWDGAPPPETTTLDPGLRRFAAAAGLAFVEIAVAPTADGLRIVAVEHHPHVERFGDAAREEIAAGLVQLLTATADRRSPDAVPRTRTRAR